MYPITSFEELACVSSHHNRINLGGSLLKPFCPLETANVIILLDLKTQICHA